MVKALSTPQRGRRIRWEDVDKSHADIQTALEGIVQAKALKSPRTLEWYRRTVGALRTWLVEQGRSTVISEITPDAVRAFLASEAAREYRLAHRIRHDPKTGQSHRYIVELPGRLSEHTLNTAIRCLRSFGRWLVKNGWLRRSPFEGLEKAGAPKLRKKVLSEDEVNRLFAKVNAETDTGARDRAMLWIFLDTGIRLSELSTLSLQTANLTDQDDGPYVQVIGKDRKERRVGLSSGARAAVVHYVEFFRPAWVPFTPERRRQLEARGVRVVEEPLFLTLAVRGIKTAGGQQVQPNAIQLIIARLAKRAGLKGLSAHTFRRTFATQNLELGASPLDVMWDLGHSSLTMTNYYASLADQNRMKRHRQYSYMEQFAGTRGRPAPNTLPTGLPGPRMR